MSERASEWMKERVSETNGKREERASRFDGRKKKRRERDKEKWMEAWGGEGYCAESGRCPFLTRLAMPAWTPATSVPTAMISKWEV
jgi:hypothetical protein